MLSSLHTPSYYVSCCGTLLHTYSRLDLLLERTASSVGVTADLASLTVWLACTPVALYYFVFAVCNRFSPRVSHG